MNLKNCKEQVFLQHEELVQKVREDFQFQFENIRMLPNLEVNLEKRVNMKINYKCVIEGNDVIGYRVKYDVA